MPSLAQQAERIAATVAPYLTPPLVPLFDAPFTYSHLLFDEYVYRLALRVFAEAKLDAALGEWGTAQDVVERAGLDPRATVAVGWMLRLLATRGALERDQHPDGPRVRAHRPLPALDPALVAAEQRAHDPACLPSYALAETVARDYPAFLRGERGGEEILFAPTRLSLWVSYFSNANPLYAVNNRVGAVALEAWMARGSATILELGGGLASGALAVLERLREAGRLTDVQRYDFTELVPAFLRRGQRLLQERWPDAPFLTFAVLDMNRPFGDQGVAPASVDVVYAVNTLHVAHDLAATLGEIRQALRPGGQLIISECVRPTPRDTLYPEFVFNLLQTFRAPRLHPDYRPNGGFLTVEQSVAALGAAGFVAPRTLPDVARIRDVFPSFYVAAIAARRPR